MALSTYTELQASIIAWAHSSGDVPFAALVPDFVRLFEARVNRTLRVRAMEKTLSSTALSSGAVTLPNGFLAFKELRYDSDNGHTLEPRPLEWVRDRSQAGGDASDVPRYFALTNTQVICTGQSGSIKGTYYEAVPALAANETNWLLTNHPDVYLFGSLVEAALHMQDENFSLWADRTAALLAQIQSADIGNQLSGGPLTVRAR